MPKRTATLLVLTAGLSVLLTGCLLKKAPDEESYGLTRVRIHMDAENLGRLNSTVWAKDPVGGRVEVGEREFGANINYSGKSTIDAVKKSFEINLTDGERFRGRSALRLSGQYADATLLRSRIGFAMFAKAGLMVPSIEPVAVWQNGKYLGLYQMVEPVDKEFFGVRGVVVRNLFKGVVGNAKFTPENIANIEGGFDSKTDPDYYSDLVRVIEAVNAPMDEDGRRALARLIDIDHYILYAAVSTILNNWDGFENNFFMYRDSPSAPFRFVPWDLDRLYDQTGGHMEYRKGNSIYGYGNLAMAVLKVEPWRSAYLQKIRDLIATVMPAADVLALIDQERDRIRAAWEADRVLTARDRNLNTETETLKLNVMTWYSHLDAELQELAGGTNP